MNNDKVRDGLGFEVDWNFVSRGWFCLFWGMCAIYLVKVKLTTNYHLTNKYFYLFRRSFHFTNCWNWYIVFLLKSITKEYFSYIGFSSKPLAYTFKCIGKFFPLSSFDWRIKVQKQRFY